ERQALALAVVHHRIPLPVARVVEVLDGHDRDDAAGGVDVLDADLGETEVTHQAFALEIPKRVELLAGGYLRVDAMELIEVDPVESQTAETAFQLPSQVLGPTVGHPLVRPRAKEAPLGGDDQPFG